MSPADPTDRESKPDRAEIETDPESRARREASNGVRQTDFVFATIESHLAEDKPFKLRPSFLGELNRLAVEGLTRFAGVPRPHGMSITGSGHAPPPPGEVQALLEELCDYVNENWQRSPVHLAAYIMWRLNWIHPYDDGNGRTSRAASYVVLSLRLKTRLPGKQTIVDQIVNSKGAYYRALEAADRNFVEGRIDVSEMEALISSLLAKQFALIHAEATAEKSS
jgi:Fic family protein